MHFLEHYHPIKGLDPVADAFSGTVSSDVVSFKDYQSFLFLVYCGVGATGRSTWTVEACDDFVPTTTSAVPFYYKEVITGDTETAMTAATASGYNPAAASSRILAIEVEAEAVLASGYPNVRLKGVEGTDSPVVGAILILGKPKAARPIPATAIA